MSKAMNYHNDNGQTARAEAAENLAEAMRILNNEIRKADQAGLTVKVEIVTMWRQKKSVPLVSVSARLSDQERT